MIVVKKILTSIMILLFPVRISFWILNILGHDVSNKAKIGFSLIFVDKLVLENGCRIGHFNLIKCINIKMSRSSYINRLNVIKGPININLHEKAAIGNDNIITRAIKGTCYGTSNLELGLLSKITAGHRIDCMQNITFGKYSTLAGSRSQLWTHGYYHDQEGPGRFRIDGEITIKDNVYIGSMCVFNPGVTIESGITVGSGSSVSKDLIKRGLYVSQPLRYIDSNSETVKQKLKKIEGFDLIENVYAKKKGY